MPYSHCRSLIALNESRFPVNSVMYRISWLSSECRISLVYPSRTVQVSAVRTPASTVSHDFYVDLLIPSTSSCRSWLSAECRILFVYPSRTLFKSAVRIPASTVSRYFYFDLLILSTSTCGSPGCFYLAGLLSEVCSVSLEVSNSADSSYGGARAHGPAFPSGN